MSQSAVLVRRSRPRQIVHRTRGRRHGPITRLMSPGDLGQILKPFVFLDLVDMGAETSFMGFGLHPHSGIATVGRWCRMVQGWPWCLARRGPR